MRAGGEIGENFLLVKISAYAVFIVYNILSEHNLHVLHVCIYVHMYIHVVSYAHIVLMYIHVRFSILSEHNLLHVHVCTFCNFVEIHCYVIEIRILFTCTHVHTCSKLCSDRIYRQYMKYRIAGNYRHMYMYM